MIKDDPSFKVSHVLFGNPALKVKPQSMYASMLQNPVMTLQ